MNLSNTLFVAQNIVNKGGERSKPVNTVQPLLAAGANGLLSGSTLDSGKYPNWEFAWDRDIKAFQY